VEIEGEDDTLGFAAARVGVGARAGDASRVRSRLICAAGGETGRFDEDLDKAEVEVETEEDEDEVDARSRS